MTSGVLDTEPAAEPAREPARESALATTTPRDLWRRARLPVVLGALVIAAAVLQALLTGAVRDDYLDPRAAQPPGGMALAELLRARGVDVRVVDVPSLAADTTVFVPIPRLVDGPALANAAAATELVVVAPSGGELDTMNVTAEVASVGETRTVDPACSQPDAVAAGDVRLGGVTYGAPEDAVACYALGGEASFVELSGPGTRRVTLLGTGSFMTNERLGEDGNAALALRLLSRHKTVEWVYPRVLPPPPGEEQGLLDLLPDRVFVVTYQLLVAVLLLALWRARRLGPVVVEPLPVVVRAAEAVEGRARLYESASARDRAAEALRAGLRDRLVRMLGLASDAGRDTLVAAVTARTRTRDGIAVDALLYGPPPVDDAALVRLAGDLDSLDSEVRAQ